MELREGYKKTDIGIIPEDWDVELVGESFQICNNLRLPISEEIRKSMQGSYPYYGPTKIQDYINEYRVEGEYSLIGEDGDHFLKWKTMSMTLLTTGRFNVNNHAHLLKGKRNVTITKWFYHYFRNRDISQFLTRQGAGRYKLSKATLATIPCAIPPLPEQKAIAEVLSDTDNLIQAFEKRIAKKRLIKQGAMQKLLTLKEGWEVKKLGDSATLKARIGWQGLTTAEYNETGDYYLVTGTEFKNGFIDWDSCYYVEYSRYKQDRNIQVKEQDVLVTKDGTIGKIAFIRSLPKPATLNSGVFVIRPIGNCFSSEFFYYILMSNIFTKFLSQLSAGSTINHLYQKDFIHFNFYVPENLEEQTRIATILSDMDKEIETLEKKLAKYNLLKQGLMQNLLTGKIRLI